jgi:hypothetical protein
MENLIAKPSDPPQPAGLALQQKAAAAVPSILLVAGLVVRLAPAYSNFLNADEVLHYLLAGETSLAGTYRATLTTAHPPLFILLLHCWRVMGSSEVFLRLPWIVCSLAFCWVAFLWVRLVAGETAARTALLLLVLAPGLVSLSSEVRQYGLLWIFCGCSLYFLETAIVRNSSWRMLFSSLTLCLALLTHYSAFLFALALGLYALVRFFSAKTAGRIVLTWAAGQVAALGVVVFLLRSHVLLLVRNGLAQGIANGYVRRSIFHRGEDHLLSFIARANLRLFHFFFSHGTVGPLALLLFIVGIALLLRDRTQGQASRLPSSRQLAFLLALPFLINCAAAVAGIYPYGGTRHDSYLAIFAMTGIAVALNRWKTPRAWVKAAVILAVLGVCYLFPNPLGERFHAGGQNRKWMAQATAALRKIPPGSTILTDDQGGMLLSYYFCHQRVVQVYEPFQPFAEAPCGANRVISIDPRVWVFEAETLPDSLRTVQKMFGLHPDERVWFFRAGWVIDSEPALRAKLSEFGCPIPQTFGQDILLCPITIERVRSH